MLSPEATPGPSVQIHSGLIHVPPRSSDHGDDETGAQPQSRLLRSPSSSNPLDEGKTAFEEDEDSATRVVHHGKSETACAEESESEDAERRGQAEPLVG
jgi:hypothetical protein